MRGSNQPNPYRQPHAAFRGLEYPGEIVLLLNPQLLGHVAALPAAGVLVVTEDPARLARPVTLSPQPPFRRVFGEAEEPDRPVLWISEAVANRLLAGTGRTVAAWREAEAALGLDEVATEALEPSALMQVEGTVHEEVPLRHVIGHLPGIDDELASRMIVVVAQYDSPPPSPDGVPYPNANDNASGVALMIEAIRTMQESGYQPFKTFLFVAYSGEGQEGGEWVTEPDISDFLQAKQGFASNFELEAVIHLRGLGAGTGDGPLFASGGSLRLATLFETAARRMGAAATRTREPVDLSAVFEERRVSAINNQEGAHLFLSWEGWEQTGRHPTDTVERVDPAKLEAAGEMLTHALMVLGRETQY